VKVKSDLLETKKIKFLSKRAEMMLTPRLKLYRSKFKRRKPNRKRLNGGSTNTEKHSPVAHISLIFQR